MKKLFLMMLIVRESGSKQLLKDEDCDLLQKVFNPSLADRRAEGELFIPPDASYSYVQKLRDLIKIEDPAPQMVLTGHKFQNILKNKMFAYGF